MLPPNYVGSLNNLTRAGIIDPATAAYVANDRPCRYSRLLNPCNPYYNQYDSFCYSQNPFYGDYQRQTFWRKVGIAILGLGGLYCGGKIFLYLAKGAKSFSLKNIFSSRKAKKAAQAAGQKTKKGGLFKRNKNVATGTQAATGTTATQATAQATATTGQNATSVIGNIGSKISAFFGRIKSKISSGYTRRVYSSSQGRFVGAP